MIGRLLFINRKQTNKLETFRNVSNWRIRLSSWRSHENNRHVDSCRVLFLSPRGCFLSYFPVLARVENDIITERIAPPCKLRSINGNWSTPWRRLRGEARPATGVRIPLSKNDVVRSHRPDTAPRERRKANTCKSGKKAQKNKTQGERGNWKPSSTGRQMNEKQKNEIKTVADVHNALNK